MRCSIEFSIRYRTTVTCCYGVERHLKRMVGFYLLVLSKTMGAINGLLFH